MTRKLAPIRFRIDPMQSILRIAFCVNKNSDRGCLIFSSFGVYLLNLLLCMQGRRNLGTRGHMIYPSPPPSFHFPAFSSINFKICWSNFILYLSPIMRLKIDVFPVYPSWCSYFPLSCKSDHLGCHGGRDSMVGGFTTTRACAISAPIIYMN